MQDKITFGVVGRVNEKLFDGQTVKTRTLTKSLRACYPECSILMAESSLSKRNFPKLLVQLVQCVRKSDVIFVLLSRNGLRILLPLLFFLNRFYRKPVIHDCIGGAHDQTLLRYPSLKKYYEKMSVIWVETESLKKKLEDLGLTNVGILPNFKNIQAVSPEDIARKDTAPFRFCTFSRVNEAKGIGRAAEAVLAINQRLGANTARLDVYGPFEENFDVVLNEYIRRSDGAISYCGIVDSDASVDVLKQYYAMLFPTSYVTEGHPGTVIDAFSAGLPVIATAQPGLTEIIKHGVNGYLYSPEEPEKLQEWMEYAITNTDEFHQMRLPCLKATRKFSTESAMETVCRKIEELLS